MVRTRSAAALLAAAVLVSCGADNTGRRTPPAAMAGGHPSPNAISEDEWFVDRAKEVGLDFTHDNGMSGKFYFPEVMAPGAALVDYDNDDDLDVYLVQGQLLGRGIGDHVPPPRQASLPPRGRLYRNDLAVAADGTRTFRFTDVTEPSGITASDYGMGVAVGDFNNDSWIDLYLTGLNRNQLWRNNGDGTFTDVSKATGTEDQGWSVSASFLDYDRDEWLDLYVGHYVEYSLEKDRRCTNVAGERSYCPPRVYEGQPGRLYRNQQDGTFTDVTEAALGGRRPTRTLGVIAADFDNDGWIDLYVANDGEENQLWMNQRNGTFKDTALVSGVALTAEGQAEASMGVDAGDFDNDGDDDLLVTTLTGEGSNLFINNGSAAFEDQSARSGINALSRENTGFGTAWIDFDNDSWLDVLSVSGLVQAPEGQANLPFPLGQRRQLFRNLRNGRFEEVTDRAGATFELSEVGRGAAFGDVDNDGDVDVLVSNDAGPTRLLINQIGSRNHWLGVRLVGANASRDMLGARVTVFRADGSTFHRRVRTDGSYASAHDSRVVVGLGNSANDPRVQIRWPSGRTEEWLEVAIDRYTTLKEGSGR
ncbi:MAG: hypothetical protein GEU82_01820 [Luteitalea sp.]|nr:hypothetical protein [Luteitalea sp.]